MRHRRKVKHFGRKSSARTALIRGLVESLVEHGRIRTTLEKAKETRRHIERAITKGNEGTISSFRLILSKYPNLSINGPTGISTLSNKFKDRNGGYTRIIKLEPRAGDNAKMAFIEFVDFDYLLKPKADSNEKNVSKSLILNKRKNVRKMKNDSRKYNR